MRTTTIFVTTLLVSIQCISQINVGNELKTVDYDSLLHNKIYRIDLRDSQYLELIEFKDGNYAGQLVNSTWEKKGKNYQAKLITQKIRVPENLAKNLMINLRAKDIEIIPKCEESPECITTGVDGTGITVTISQRESKKSYYYYWEVESDYYYKKGDIPINIQKLRNILSYLENSIHYKNQFTRFIDYLPKGTYTFGGIGIVKL